MRDARTFGRLLITGTGGWWLANEFWRVDGASGSPGATWGVRL